MSFIKNIWDKISGPVIDKIVPFFFEEVPGLKKIWEWINGHKTEVGRVAEFLVVVTAGASAIWSDIPILENVELATAAVVAWLFREMGMIHATSKVRRGIEK